jgi:hypothetical protein
MVTINEAGFIIITNWNKRQYKSDNAYQRVKKFREVSQKRNVSCNDIETAPDTDTDTDKKKYIKKEKYSSDFELFWKEYPSKVAKGDAFKCWSKINGQRPDLSVILSAIQKQKDWRKNANGAFRPEWKHPASWLNKGCWEDEVVAPQAGRKPW